MGKFFFSGSCSMLFCMKQYQFAIVTGQAQPAHAPEPAQPPPMITYQRRRRTSG